MAEALVTLTLKDSITQQLRGVQREMQNTSAIAKAMGQSLEAKQLASVAQQLGQVANNVGQTGKSFSAAEKEADRATSTLKSAGNALQAFGRGAGGGGIMSLLGIGGLTAAAGALGAIVANAVRLASEFNKISTGSVYSMTTGAGSLQKQMEAFKSATYGVADIGIGAGTASRMLATYGAASGRADYVSQGRSIGEWAKAYGQDPIQFAQQAGGLAQLGGGNVDRTMAQTFGAASQMGDAGRRIPEVLGTLSDVLSKMETSSPDKQVSTRDALREVLGVTSMGGNYTSTVGMQTALTGFQQLGGANRNPAVMANEAAAGWNMEDIITGTQDPKKLASVFKRMYATQSQSMFELNLMSQYGETGAQARSLYGIAKAHGGEFLASDINAPASKAEETKRLADFAKSPEGLKESALAKLENAQTKAGDVILTRIAPAADKIASGIDKLVDYGLANGDTLGKMLNALQIIAIVSAASQGVGALAKISAGLGQLLPGAMAAMEGAGGAVGAGAAAAGTALGSAGTAIAGAAGTVAADTTGLLLGPAAAAAALLTLTVGRKDAGNADESDPNAAWRKGSKASSDRRVQDRAKRDAIATLWVAEGGDVKLARKMGDVAMNESGGDPNAMNPNGAAGLMQIYGHGIGNWRDPITNMREAVALSKQSVAAGYSPFRPWEDSRTKGAHGGWDSAQTRREFDTPAAGPGSQSSTPGSHVSTHRTPTHSVKVETKVTVTPTTPTKATGGTNRAL